jgi:hypothetical protein
VLLLIAVPVLLALLSLVAPGRTHRGASWAVAAMLLLGCVVAVFSVGVFYLPTAILLLVAAMLDTLEQPPATAA